MEDAEWSPTNPRAPFVLVSLPVFSRVQHVSASAQVTAVLIVDNSSFYHCRTRKTICVNFLDSAPRFALL